MSDSDNGGYACNAMGSLTQEELAAPAVDAGKFKGVKPGDTIEVHWVNSSCDIEPGEGLGSCLSETCENPLLRVEAQVFLVANDEGALDFADFAYDGNVFNETKSHGVRQLVTAPELLAPFED